MGSLTQLCCVHVCIYVCVHVCVRCSRGEEIKWKESMEISKNASFIYTQ